MFLVRCPICGKQFSSTESDAMPFCGSRCRQIDLRRWLDEENSVPYDPPEDEEGLDDEASD